MSRLKTSYDNFIRWLVGSYVYDIRLSELSNKFAVSLNVLAGVISVLYLVTDLLIGEIVLVYAHILLLLGFLTGVILFRFDRIETAKSAVLLVFNIALFMVTAAEPVATGSSIYLLLLMIGAIIVFDYEKMRYSVLFIALPFVSYIISNKTDFSILPHLDYPEQTIDSFFFINITVFTISTSLILFLYIQMIYFQKKKIKDQNERLKQTNHELDYFLYSTSHDLRAPLTTLLGLINLAEGTVDKTELKSYHRMMKTRVDKMDIFIKDIIDVIRNSRMPVTHEAVAVKPLIDNIIQELDNPMGFHPVNWRNNISDDTEIMTDGKRLTTILKNLISNAVKYSDPQKEEPFVGIEETKNGESYSIQVVDNGMGIEDNQLPKIFDMFYRATENSKGAGLGLYIAVETTHTIGGKLNVFSKVGEGSTFEVKLPIS